jgi:hypothetical protein
MPLHKCSHIRRIRWLPNQIRHVECKKIARLQKSLDGIQIDVIRIQKVGLGPPEFLDRRIGREPRLAWVRTDNQVLPVGFIPYRHHLDSSPVSEQTCRKLRLRLMRKPVAHTNRKFWELQSFIHLQHPSSV